MVRTYLERKDKDKGKEKKKLTLVQPQPNKDKTTQNFLASQHFDGGKKEKPARPHNWSSFLKEFLSPVSMGRTPAEQLQRQAMAPHERFRLEANDLIVKKVNCSPAERQKAQEELHHGVWDISKYLTDFSIMKNLRSLFFLLRRGYVLFLHPPPTCHTPVRPPDCPVSLFGPWEFKAGLFGAAQCALTPCNEISSCY